MPSIIRVQTPSFYEYCFRRGLLLLSMFIGNHQVESQVECTKVGLNSMAVDEATKKRIDAWIKAEGRNDFGDPKGTNYAGGTPLFDMRTGRTRDRYDYILERNPQLKQEPAS